MAQSWDVTVARVVAFCEKKNAVARFTVIGKILNLNGNFNFNLSLASLVEGNEWRIVDTSGSTSWSGLKVNGTSGAFTNDGGVWTLVDGDNIWTFSQTMGFLSLSVPEPSAAVLLLAGLSGFLVLRSRRLVS